MRFFIVLCCVVAVVSGKAARRQLDPKFRDFLVSGRVVGGTLADDGQFPYQVSLQVGGAGFHYCGGNIVAPDLILTAAHCVQGGNPADYMVCAGINNLNDASGQCVNAAELNWNTDFPGAGGLSNDVAYIRLEQPLELNEKVDLIKLPTNGQTPSLAPGDCTVSGWGATDSFGSVYPDELHFGDIQGLSDDDCQELMDNLANPPFGVEFEPEANFCAYTPEGGVNACFGDSGGPLTCVANEDGERYLFGIVSWGPTTCGEQGFPAIYADVVTYLPWFAENAGIGA